VIEPEALRELRAAAGDSAVLEHDATGLDGAQIGVTLAPASPADLAEVLSLCTRHDVPVVLRGGGSRLGLGNRPRGARAWLSTAALEPVCEVDGDEGVARVGASVQTAELGAAARAAGWRSPLEAPSPVATVGGALATAATAPRALGLGAPRRAVLGLDVALATGERTRCGGRVVKNVSGYDLAKLYVGSFGTLGVVTEAWLRLRPRPEAERTLAARVGADGLALALAAARRPAARASALVDAELAGDFGVEGAGDLLLVDLAGDVPVVEAGETWLRGEAGVVALPDGIERLHGLQEDPGGAPLRFRVSAPPTHLAHLRERLRAAGASTIVHPGLSQAIAFFELARADAVLADAAWRAVRGVADPAAGIHGVLEHAPAFAKEGRDVFDAPAATLPLMRAVKARFDPGNILNPGRFVGGL
jgi:glycolate oxidase FAD binding subunit